jgi:hypothetical protein
LTAVSWDVSFERPLVPPRDSYLCLTLAKPIVSFKENMIDRLRSNPCSAPILNAVLIYDACCDIHLRYLMDILDGGGTCRVKHGLVNNSINSIPCSQH